MRTAINYISLTLIIFTMSGCMANMSQAIGIDSKNTLAQDQKFIEGDYNASALLAVENKDLKSDLDKSNLLSTLRAGNAYLYAKNYTTSKKMLDEAEAIIKFQNEDAMAETVAEYTAQLLLNDAALDYRATITEAIMVNTYKSLAFMADRKFDDARIELNRAVDRQRRAKETYAEVIGKQKESIQKDKQKASSINKTLNDRTVTTQIAQNNPFGAVFQVYPDFINPFSTYLAGLFFAIEGDYIKSESLLKEVKKMMPKNSVVATDYKMVNDAADGKEIKDHYVWVIFEDGLAPIKTEYRIDIPLFLFSNKVSYTGIALPKMKARKDEFNGISVISNNNKIAQTEIVADMDRVILTEFKYGYNDIVVRAVLSAILKTYAQYKSQKSNDYLGLAMSVMQFLTTHADTRTWSTLPKNFQVARVKIPKDHKLTLSTANKHISIEISKSAKHAIVYVRIPTAISVPSVSVINF